MHFLQLVLIPCKGPCQTDKCMVVSGAKAGIPIANIGLILPVEIPENELKHADQQFRWGYDSVGGTQWGQAMTDESCRGMSPLLQQLFH